MKILVCISQVPDTTTKISFKDNDTAFNEDKVTYIVNPYDEWYALVRALELKEAAGSGNVTIITVGTATVEPIIRKALAIGADDAVRINMDPKDAYSTAKVIADYASQNAYDLIMCGKETIDYNGSEVGGMIAGLMDLPFVSHAISLQVADGKAVLEIDIENGTEEITASLPLVLSAAKGMAEARIPNMRGIMAARTKSIQVVEASEAPLTEVKKFTLPAPKSAVKLIDSENIDQLVELLHSEAKVI